MSKRHIVGNLMHWLICLFQVILHFISGALTVKVLNKIQVSASGPLGTLVYQKVQVSDNSCSML